jgi:mutator protein MutT
MKRVVMTLLFLKRDGEILLAQKKRGFGEGRWNGVGGKVDPGETIEQAAVRETQEEIEVTPMQFKQVALHTFDVFYNGEPTILEGHVFMCTEWEGEPVETEEMRPQWYKTTDIPYDDMWQDDRHWLPQVLDDKKVMGTFLFDKDDNFLEHNVQEVTSFAT